MLPKKERLTKADFINLKPRIVFRGTYIDMATALQDKLKFSCVISKKRIKRAVDRNSVRRKIYSILLKERPDKTCFIIIYPKHTTLGSPYSHIQEEVRAAFDTL